MHDNNTFLLDKYYMQGTMAAKMLGVILTEYSLFQAEVRRNVCQLLIIFIALQEAPPNFLPRPLVGNWFTHA